MDSLFFKIDAEKQKNIINASLEVFSKKEFKHASTDDIAAIAGIAKGSLFRYFKNKRGLYLYLYEYSMGTLRGKSEEDFDFQEKDFFEIIKQSIEIKLNLLEEYPNMYGFLIQANQEQDEELAVEIERKNREAKPAMMDSYYGEVDREPFKEGINLRQVSRMIEWCAEGLRKDALKNEKTYREVQEETMDIIEFFKGAVYKVHTYGNSEEGLK